MGAGIAEVFARNGYDVVGAESNDDGVERGRQHLEHSTERAVKRGKLTEAEQAELLGRITFTTELKDLGRRDFVVEAVVERWRSRRAIFAELDDDRRARRDPRHQHLLAVGHRDLDRQLPPGRVIGVHFFNPAPVQNLVEIIRTVVTEPSVLADVQALVRPARQEPGRRAATRPASSPTRCSSATSTTPCRCTRAATPPARTSTPRCGSAAGYPMGPLALLDLIGLDTAYEILDTMYKQGRDRLHAPAPDPQADGHRRAAGPQDRPGLLHLRGARTARSWSPTTTPRSADDKPQLRHPVDLVGVVGTGTMASGIVEVFAKAGYDVAVRRRGPRTRSTGSGRPSSGRWTRRSSAASCEESTQGRRLARLTGSTSLDDLADVDLVVEAIAEDLAIKTTLFANLDEICKPGAILATTTSSPAGDRAGQGHQPPRGRRRDALLQPGPGHEAGRGGLHRRDRRRRSRDRARAVRPRSARSRCRAATGPGSSSTRCCSRTSTTR